MTENATPQFAHEIVPDPIRPDQELADVYPDDLLRELVRYHAARAQAFHLATLESPNVTAVTAMLNEYHLASLYDMMRSQILNPAGRVAFTVADLNITMRAYPEAIGPGIRGLCEVYGVDTASIKAYRP